MEKKIYLVTEYGGQYEDSWETTLHAFSNMKDAMKFADEHDKSMQIDEDLYSKIEDALSDKEYELDEKYTDGFDRNTYKTIMKGEYTEEDYNKALDEWHDTGRYDFVKEKFGITKEELLNMERARTWDYGGVRVMSVSLD